MCESLCDTDLVLQFELLQELCVLFSRARGHCRRARLRQSVVLLTDRSARHLHTHTHTHHCEQHCVQTLHTHTHSSSHSHTDAGLSRKGLKYSLDERRAQSLKIINFFSNTYFTLVMTEMIFLLKFSFSQNLLPKIKFIFITNQLLKLLNTQIKTVMMRFHS